MFITQSVNACLVRVEVEEEGPVDRVAEVSDVHTALVLHCALLPVVLEHRPEVLTPDLQHSLVCVDLLVVHHESHVGRLHVIEGELHGVVDTRAGADLRLHGDVGHAGGGETREDLNSEINL